MGGGWADGGRWEEDGRTGEQGAKKKWTGGLVDRRRRVDGV